MSNLKQALSIEDQIDLLKNRGLQIEDYEEAKNVLQDCTYYRLNYYFKKFIFEKNCFSNDCSFRKILNYYYFDQWLRIYILSMLEPIEVAIRSRIAYHLAINYGSDCFYRDDLFDSYSLNKISQSFNQEIYRNYKDPVVVHHKEKYEGQFPIWVIVQFLSFTNISLLYASMGDGDRQAISTTYFRKLNSKYLKSWLHSLSVLRNLCAHHVPMYCRNYTTPPLIGNLFEWDSDKNIELFVHFLIIKRITDNSEWEQDFQSLINKLKHEEQIEMSGYGFPKNWMDILQ
jgi:abortive infection bacteriophage resistance protein